MALFAIRNVDTGRLLCLEILTDDRRENDGDSLDVVVALRDSIPMPDGEYNVFFVTENETLVDRILAGENTGNLWDHLILRHGETYRATLEKVVLG